MFSSEAGRAAAGSLKLGTPKKDFVLVKVRVDLKLCLLLAVSNDEPLN